MDQVNGKTMNKESPKAGAPLPLAGTEQAVGEAEQIAKKQKPEESSLTDDLVSDAIDVVISIFE